ncbi:MAG: DUF4351 domain-containing protein [Deinococcales bacterium]
MSDTEALDHIDHDQIFKTLLESFFLEFVELFFPELAQYVDAESLEPLSLKQELYTTIFEGKKFTTDLIMQVKFCEGAPDEGARFLIHIEHQSSNEPDFPKRMYNYFSLLFTNQKLPVYPIVVFSHDSKKPEANRYSINLANKTILEFCYSVVQLSLYDWRNYLSSNNPLASALTAKMDIAKRDRAKVKLECLRLLSGFNLTPAKTRLLSGFIDTYLRLNLTEQLTFERDLEALIPARKEKIVELTTSWEQKGIEKGIIIGEERGEQRGEKRGIGIGKLDLVLRQLARKFKQIDMAEKELIEALKVSELDELAEMLLDFEDYRELQVYLTKPKQDIN